MLQAARESLEQEVVVQPAEAPVQAAGECAAVTQGGVGGLPADQGLASCGSQERGGRGRTGPSLNLSGLR